MYAVIEKDGTFSGVTYDELSDKIHAHHTKFGQTFLKVETEPVDVSPPPARPGVNHTSDYGSPTAEQIRVGGNWKHRAYLAETDWLVVRAAEGGTPVPPEVVAKRVAARAAVVD